MTQDKARIMEIAQDNLKWFVETDQPMTTDASLSFLTNVVESVYEMARATGRCEQLHEVLSKLGEK